MRVLVHAEHVAGAVRDTAFELLAIARALGGEVEALAIGAEPQALAGQLGAADRVIAVADAVLEAYLPDAHGAALQAAIRARNPDLVLLSYGTAGLDIAPAAAHACALPSGLQRRRASAGGGGRWPSARRSTAASWMRAPAFRFPPSSWRCPVRHVRRTAARTARRRWRA